MGPVFSRKLFIYCKASLSSRGGAAFLLLRRTLFPCNLGWPVPSGQILFSMGLFSRRSRSNASDPEIQRIIDLFFTRAQDLGIGVSKEDLGYILSEQQKLAAEEDKTYKLPDNYGDLLIQGVQRGEPQSYAFVSRAVEGGATFDDVRAWWNLPDLERRMYTWESNALLQILYRSLVENGHSQESAYDEMARLLPSFDDNLVGKKLESIDQPLPPELRPWIYAFCQSSNDSLHPALFAEASAGDSSMNAFFRKQRVVVRFREPLNRVRKLHQSNQIKEALNLALTIYASITNGLPADDPYLIAMLSDLAPIFQAGGRYELNLGWMEKAIKTYAPDDRTIPILLNNLGLQYTEMNRFQDAVDAFHKAYNWFRDHPDQYGEDLLRVRITQNMALAYSRAGQYEEAIPFYEAVLSSLQFQEGGLAESLSILTKSNLSLAYLGINNLPEAAALQKEVIAIREDILELDHPDLATSYDSLGNILLAQKDYEASLAYMQKAADIRLKRLGEKHPDYTLSLSNMALVHAKLEAWDKVIEKLLPAVENRLDQIRNQYLYLSEAEQKAFFNQLSSELEFFKEICVRLHTQYPELIKLLCEVQILTRGLQIRSLTQLKTQLGRSENQELNEKFSLWLSLKSHNANSYGLLDPAGKKVESDEEQVQLEKYLRKHAKGFKNSILEMPDYSQIQAKLKKGEVLIDCFAGTSTLSDNGTKYFGLLLLSSEAANPELITLPEANTSANSLLQSYRGNLSQIIGSDRNLSFEIPEKTIAESHDLYQKLWQPIEQAIGNCQKLYVLPDGIFYQINLETLWQPEQKCYLKDLLHVQRINHIADIFSAQGDHNENPPVLIGDPDFGPSDEIAPLAGTKLEVEAIDRLLAQKGETSELYLGRAASKENIQSLNQPRLLHIATHGYYQEPSSDDSSIIGASFKATNKNPYLQAGLLLEGAAKDFEVGWGSHPGILTAMEVANLNLFNTELVVLSACNSGLGKIQQGEGVYGLARAFREAGAQKVMYSLWPVADKATADLMQYFYQFWLDGNTVDEAFSQAQDRLREQYPEPVYWGAFLLV